MIGLDVFPLWCDWLKWRSGPVAAALRPACSGSTGMELPLPPRLQCVLTIKSGKALERCRDKGTVCTFECQPHEGYDVLRAKVKATMTARDIAWNESIEIYLKPAKQVPQRSFLQLGVANFIQTLTQAWHTARLRRGGQSDFTLDLFVYLGKPKKAPHTTLHRATENRVQQALPRVREAMEAANIEFGPASLRYAATTQARLPDTHPIQIPESTTFRQLQHIDTLQRQHDTADASHTESEYADIEVKINNAPVVIHMKVQDLRRALGLPPFPLCPPFRQVVSSIPPPDEDMEDIDHALTDDEELVDE